MKRLLFILLLLPLPMRAAELGQAVDAFFAMDLRYKAIVSGGIVCLSYVQFRFEKWWRENTRAHVIENGRKLEDLKEQVGDLRAGAVTTLEKVEGVATDIGRVDAAVAQVRTVQGKQSKRIEGVAKDVKSVDAAVVQVQAGQKKQTKQMAARHAQVIEQHEQTTRNLALLKAKTMAIETLLKQLSGKADRHASQLATLTTQVASLPTDIIIQQLLNERIDKTEKTLGELIRARSFDEQERTSILACVASLSTVEREVREVRVIVSALLIEQKGEQKVEGTISSDGNLLENA